MIALSKRQNAKPVQAGAKGNMTFLLLGSLQNVLWVLWITPSSMKRTVVLQSRPWVTVLIDAVIRLLPPRPWKRISLAQVFWTFVPPLTFKWLFGYFSSLGSWQGGSVCLWSALPQQEGGYWPPFSSPAGKWPSPLGNSRESCGKEMLSFWCLLEDKRQVCTFALDPLT